MRLLGIPVLRQGNVIELMPLNAVETQKLKWSKRAAAFGR